MSWFFNRKSEPIPCNHKWKDFPWYYEAEYDMREGVLHAKIIEPYVCIHCKERKDVILRDFVTCCSSDDAEKIIEDWKDKYKDRLMDSTYIEDMIADMQLVDREYLELAESIINPKRTET